MKIMLIYSTILVILMFMMFFMMSTISKKAIINNQKSTPFECGFNPMSYTRMSFSIHFFMIAVIFLIFDIEIILVMPVIITIKSTMIKYWITNSIMFTMILILGLFHEWSNGMIKWTY